MTDNFKEIGSLFGREGAGAGFAKQTDKESFTYAFAWPEGDTWATLTGYLNLDEQPEAGRRPSMISGTVSLRVATTFPWRATTAHPAGTRSRRMHLQGMRPERITRTSDRTRSDKK